jgi:hypothetical protein
MKNKKNIYILLPLVLLVWGAVLFQLFSFTNSDEITVSDNPEFTFKPMKVNKRESFSINVNYRDPFLGKIYSNESETIPKKTNSTVHKAARQAEALVWPKITYKGSIADSKGKNSIYIMIIDGKNYYMKIGDTENEIFLKSGDKESVYVKYKGNLNIIMLQD